MPDSPILTDAEIVAGFMEPKPEEVSHRTIGDHSPLMWWRCCLRANPSRTTWDPTAITLNECRLVEARLSENQWEAYDQMLIKTLYTSATVRAAIHAPAETKLAALAAVIRSTK